MYLQHSNQCLIYFPGPDFVTSVEDGDYVYFFFREKAVEYINCGKVIFYRLKPTAAGICPSSPPQLCTTEQSKPFFPFFPTLEF